MKRLLMCLIMLIFACQFLFAGYKENMAAGNDAYKKGDMETALKYYDLVLEEQPSDQLFAFTDKIRKKIEDKKKTEQAGTKGSNTPVLIAIDVVLSGFAVFSYLDYSTSVNDYETLFKAIDNTSHENYKILEYEQKKVDQKGNFMAFAAGAAGVAIVYTLVDMFLLNGSSPAVVKAEINTVDRYAGLNAQWRF
jgi:hypothetical protein